MKIITADELAELITSDMRQAMKNSQRVELDELRSLFARISNAEAISLDDDAGSTAGILSGAIEGVGDTEAQRKILSVADIKSIILAEIAEIKDTLIKIDSNSEYATDLHKKVAVIQKYL